MGLINKLDRYLEDNDYQIIIKESSINIVNFNEIIDFSVNQIIIKCRTQTIIIDGRNLTITKMLDNEILISGMICNIRIN